MSITHIYNDPTNKTDPLGLRSCDVGISWPPISAEAAEDACSDGGPEVGGGGGAPVPGGHGAFIDFCYLVPDRGGCESLFFTLKGPNGSGTCRRTLHASAKDYLEGFACLPNLFDGARGEYGIKRFNYTPDWRGFDGHSRWVRPNGECSWYPDTGYSYDFQNPCKGHDLCYDLVREDRVTNGSHACDDLLVDDVFTHCGRRHWIIRTDCQVEARFVQAALRAPGRPRPD